MKRTSKIFIGTIATISLATLAGCSSGSKAPATVSVKSQSYVLSESKSNLSTDEGFVALKVSIKNDTKKSFEQVTNYDFKLKDKKGNELSVERVYDSNDEFKILNSESSLSPDKTVSGYLVFKVDKGSKYELHYKPEMEQKNKKTKNDVVVKVDTSQATDQSKVFTSIAKSYVDQTFLGKDSSNKSLGTDLTESKKNFDETFTKAFTSDLSSSGANYKPSQDQTDKVLKSLKSTNADKGSVDYKTIEMFPTSAIVAIKPEVVSFDNVDMEGLVSSYEDKANPDSDYDEIMNGAVKYVLEQLPSKIASSKIEEPSNMDSEGYKMTLTKDKSGKWNVNNSNSSDNYDYRELQEAFMGGEN
ncbi:DUF4352 domain-containing protein [Lactococcus lactis]|uniref:DUF4352 domain-containing protein n=1 Tax=Lactococcus lactis TaxID=1358 RepID=UPI0022E63B38|nr:DUF4352 domain-containing protein [Lactococcus lactis]